MSSQMSPTPSSISFVLPAYQEQNTLEDTAKSILSVGRSLLPSFEIVLVNDGSTDNTPGIADQLGQKNREVTVLHQSNQGIGGAFRAGLSRAQGEYVMLWPADMPMTPADLAPFLESLGRADVLVGVRPRRAGYNWLMRFNSIVYVAALRLFCDLRLKDVNWICAYRRRLLSGEKFAEKGVPMLAEMLLLAREKGASFIEVESPMKARIHGRPSASRLRVMWKSLLGLARLCRRFSRLRKRAQT